MLDRQGKTERLTRQLEAYLSEILRLQGKARKWPGEKTLPLFLRELYVFYWLRILNREAVLMLPKGREEPTPATVAQHMRKVREKGVEDLVLVTEAVSSLYRKRLIEQQIPFIVPGNQLYLPMLGMDLREHFRSLRTAKPGFSPATQVLVLDALYHPRQEADMPTAAAGRLGYSVMTLTRAFDELEQAGLGEHTVKGKERRLALPDKPLHLWEAALPFLKKPVNKFRYAVSKLPAGTGFKAGLSALSEYSHLAPPDTESVAVDAEAYRGIVKTAILETHNPGPGSQCIELWAYPPARFGKKGIADPLSVYLSLKHEEDERVQQALKELLRGMKW
jgi:hypothetical protein